MPDIFDRLAQKKEDIFDRIIKDINRKAGQVKSDIFDEVNKKFPSLVRNYIRSYLQKQRDSILREASKIVHEEISKIEFPKSQERVIERRFIEEKKIGPIVDNESRKLINDLKSEIGNLKNELKKVKEESFISIAPLPLPNQEHHSDDILSTDGHNAKWISKNGIVYSGDPNTEGTWRLYDDGTNWIAQRLENGSWVEKSGFEA
jgi:hypothetical protein